MKKLILLLAIALTGCVVAPAPYYAEPQYQYVWDPVRQEYFYVGPTGGYVYIGPTIVIDGRHHRR